MLNLIGVYGKQTHLCKNRQRLRKYTLHAKYFLYDSFVRTKTYHKKGEL